MTTPATAAAPAHAHPHATGGVAALTVGNFVVGTGAAVVVGILPLLASDLRVSPGAVGQLSTAYGLAACFVAPFLGGISSRFARRDLLVAVLVLSALLCLAAALSPGYWTLLAVRALAGAVGVLYASQAALTASLIVPFEQRGRAMGTVFAGVASSSIIGLPIGTWLGAHYGWRITFAGLGIVGLLSAVGVWRLLPSGLLVPAVGRAAWKAVVEHPLLTRTLLLSMLQYCGQSSLYFYLALAYVESIDAGAGLVSLMLSLFGVSAIVGNIVGGRLSDRFGAGPVFAAAVSGMATAFVLWRLGHGSVPVMAVATALWGACAIIPNSAQQVRLVNMSAPLATVSVALNSSAVFFGQSFGAAMGGLVVTLYGVRELSLFGVPFLVAAVLYSLRVDKRARRQAAKMQTARRG